MKFLVISDLHFKDSGPNSDSIKNIEKILSLDLQNLEVDLILIIGDLTDSGSNGENDCIDCHFRKTNKNELIKYQEFEKKLKKPVLLCIGNHDTYTVSINTHIKKFFRSLFNLKPIWPKNTIQRHILDNINSVSKNISKNVISKNIISTFYYDKIINNIHFICLGLYPGPVELNFLKSCLTDKYKTIIFFHYNVEGPFSDWFPENDKENFFNYIYNYTNILCICVGHRHESYVSYFLENKFSKKFKIISGAGEFPILCTIENDILTNKFLEI